MRPEDRPIDRATERLFIAVPLPEGLLSYVEGVQRLLPATGGMRLARPDQLHVTLAFIGEADLEKREAARAVVEGVPHSAGGQAMVSGFLMLPSPGRTRVVALALDDSSGVFERLYERVMGGLEAARVMKREKRPFRAHMTIARLRDPRPVRPTDECAPVSYPVESVCLYRSELRREGARYTVLSRADLDAVPR